MSDNIENNELVPHKNHIAAHIVSNQEHAVSYAISEKEQRLKGCRRKLGKHQSRVRGLIEGLNTKLGAAVDNLAAEYYDANEKEQAESLAKSLTEAGFGTVEVGALDQVVFNEAARTLSFSYSLSVKSERGYTSKPFAKTGEIDVATETLPAAAEIEQILSDLEDQRKLSETIMAELISVQEAESDIPMLERHMRGVIAKEALMNSEDGRALIDAIDGSQSSLDDTLAQIEAVCEAIDGSA